jgi:hypothetical protein
MKKENTNKGNTGMMIAVIVIVAAVVILGAFFLLNQQSSQMSTTSPTTISTPNLTSTAVTSLITTIVKNQSTATGPNMASCNGYNYSMSIPNQDSVGSCNWRGGLMNVSIFGGQFASTSLTIVQQNVTTAPYNATFAGATCNTKSGVFFIPIGNYKVTFSTGSQVVGSSCGDATVRLSTG